MFIKTNALSLDRSEVYREEVDEQNKHLKTGTGITGYIFCFKIGSRDLDNYRAGATT
jgi:hypothetical protein